MARRTKKRSYKHFAILGILISLSLAFFGFNYRLWRERQSKQDRLEELEAELTRVENQKEALREGLDEVDDREYIERILREDFLMKKPGEEAVVILTEDEEEEETALEEEEDEEESFWDRLPFME